MREPDLTRSQLLLDDFWIEDQQRLTRQWHQADIFPEPVLRPEEPWEGTNVTLYGSVMRLGERWRLYYTTYKPLEDPIMCVAESDDGLHWERPIVGTIEYDGSTQNNIVACPANCPSVMHDPDDTTAPFKMIRVGALGQARGILGATSKDGLHWTGEECILTPCGDVQSLWPERVDGQYVITLKTARGRERYGTRCVSIALSDDFRTFSEPELIHRPDLVDAADIEYHGMPGFPYGDLHLGMLERWHNVPNFIEVQLSWSHDLKQWHRPPPTEPFIGPTFPWNLGWSTCCSSGPVQVGNQLWFYFGGRSDCHFHVKQAPPQYSAVGLATITVDRFASISAGFMEGKLVTVPMTWPGGDLLLNASTTRHHDGYPLDGGGQMHVEVQDEEGRPLEGFSGDDHAVFTGNVPTRGTVDLATVRWPGDRSLSELAGRRLKLVFRMRDAHLYSFRSSG